MRRTCVFVLLVLNSAPCQEILLWYLSHTETSAALSSLRQLSDLQEPENNVAAGLCFAPGSDGGARCSSRESSR